MPKIIPNCIYWSKQSSVLILYEVNVLEYINKYILKMVESFRFTKLNLYEVLIFHFNLFDTLQRIK